MITKEKLDLIVELMYEFRDFELKESEIGKIINHSFVIPALLNELMTKKVITFNAITHKYRFNESDQAIQYLNSMTKV